MVKGVFYGALALFLIIGILLGLKRGLIKSTIRIATVLISCILVIFLTPTITSAVLKANISNLNLVIDGMKINTLGEAIVSYISQISVVAGLLETSPTLKAVVSALPMIVVNLILFVILFFIVKGIFYFIAMIANRIILGKNSERPKRRLWGALIGGVQGVIVFLFILIPIAGAMNLVTDTMDIVEVPTTKQEQSISLANVTTINTANENNDNLQETIDLAEATKQIDDYNDIFVLKAFNALGYKKLSNSVFDKLTTMELAEKKKTTLRSETTVLAKSYNSYLKIQNVNLDNFSEEDEKNTNELIENVFSSPLISGIATELTTGLADAWVGSNPQPFVGVEKPTLNAKLVKTFDNLLINLRNDNSTDLKNDLQILVSTLRVSSKYNLTQKLNSGTTDELVKAIGEEGCVEELVGTLAKGKVTKQILPTVIEVGIIYGYDAVGVESEVTIVKTADEVNWDTEKVILGDLFENVSRTYLSTQQEGEILDKIDLISFAGVLDNLRRSQLLHGASQDITIKFLTSNLLSGVDTSTLVDYISNDAKYNEINFVTMFTTLKSSADIAKDIKNSTETGNPSLDKKDVSNLLDGLTKDDTTKNALKDLASSDNLEKAGVDSATAGAVSGLVDSITDYDTTAEGAVQTPKTDEEIDSATNAVEDLLGASKNALDTEKSYIFSDDEETAKAKMKQFTDNMLSSEFIYASTINKGENLGFKQGSESNLSANEQIWLIEVLKAENSANPEKYTAEKCAQIADMFGVVYA